MALPFSIALSQVDAKSPVDDNLMTSIKYDLEYLDGLFSGGNYNFSFGLDGQLIGAAGFYRAVDIVPLYKEYIPNVCRVGLRKSGTSGNLTIDIRKHIEVKIPITGIDHQFEAATQSIANVAPALATQSITLATASIATQSITFAKSAINVSSIILIGSNRVRYNLASSPDSDYAIGDSITFAGCTSAANNGTFTIVEINQSGASNIVIVNASGVAQTAAAGTAQLQLMSYNFTNPVSSEFVSGESAIFATHTSANNNGTLAIFKTNQAGNNIWVKKSNGVTQAGVAGTVQCARWVYTYSAPVSSPDFTVGEKAKMASHTTAANNGNFTITALNSGGFNIVVYNTAGVLQGGVAGTANTNRWIYSFAGLPITSFTVGETAQLESHTTAANNGLFEVKQINRSSLFNIVIYNESGVVQGAPAGFTRHTKKLIKFASDQSANFTTSSFIEMVGTVSGFYVKNDGRLPFQVLQINRGGGSNYNVVVLCAGAPSQASPAGYVQTEMKSIFNTLPTLTPDVTSLEANEWLQGSFTDFVAGSISAGSTLGLYILEMPDGDPQTLRVTLHS